VAQQRRSIIYIDGFNLYYGLLRSPKYKGCKWLNLEESVPAHSPR